MPIYRRLPKRGFKGKPSSAKPLVVSVGEVQRLVDQGMVKPDHLLSSQELGGKRARYRPVKLLSDGDIRSALHIRVESASARAVQKIVAAGGSVKLASQSTGGHGMRVEGEMRRDDDDGLTVDIKVNLSLKEISGVDLGEYKLLLDASQAEFAESEATLRDMGTVTASRNSVLTKTFNGHATSTDPIVAMYLFYRNRLLFSEDLRPGN